MSAKRTRLDQALVEKGLVVSRSQGESMIKLGQVTVDGRVVTKPGFFVNENANITLSGQQQYVSRAGLKLASIAEQFNLDFRDKVVLDVGSSTGGFTDYALRSGAQKVIAVDVGTDQLHPSLHNNPKIELHEQTDIRKFVKGSTFQIDIVVIDVSFISLREILPYVAKLSSNHTQIVAMMKPQFEAGNSSKHKGVIKNDHMRRDILHYFEQWAKQDFVLEQKADSQVAGAKGNIERFYLLHRKK